MCTQHCKSNRVSILKAYLVCKGVFEDVKARARNSGSIRASPALAVQLAARYVRVYLVLRCALVEYNGPPVIR